MPVNRLEQLEGYNPQAQVFGFYNTFGFLHNVSLAINILTRMK